VVRDNTIERKRVKKESEKEKGKIMERMKDNQNKKEKKEKRKERKFKSMRTNRK
jgi:hypothetical protein